MNCSIHHIPKSELKRLIRTMLASDEWHQSAKNPQVLTMSSSFADLIKEACEYCRSGC